MLVVDASVALKWFVEEPCSEHAAALLSTGQVPAGPDLIVADVCNAAWKAVVSGTMTAEQQDHAASRLPAIFDELAALAPLAVEISRTLGHSAYDCFYLALAEQRGAIHVTADRQLLRRTSGTDWGGRITGLAEFRARQAGG